MTPDIDIKSFYLKYITSAKKDAIEYRKHREEAKKIKEELYKYIDENKDIILDAYGIDVTKYELEWNKKYNDGEGLYNKCIRCANTISHDDVNKRHILQVIKYCNALRNEYKYARLTELSYKRENLNINQYRDYLGAFFNKVHKCVLEGHGYEFGYGIGTFIINRWKLLGKTKKKMDYQATKKRKEELLQKGYKLFDKLEATWYKHHNIPYDGVDYRVWRTEDYCYEVGFYNTTLFSRSALEYVNNEYINKFIRGMSYKELAEKVCKSVNDVYNLKADIKVKLSVLLNFDPNKYLNFIRNVEQDRSKFRANRSKNRQ